MAHQGVFFRGETVVVEAIVHRGHSSSPVDADAVTISVYDNNNGPEIGDAPMINDAVGHYHYDINTEPISCVGKCKVVIKAIIGGRTSIDVAHFTLAEQVI